ncbi:hypothetical protein PHLGIDRAFT_421079 [Phlebiopsis gigantea 11061_1 CR5-6]|uniref:Uncharacterized protein n=1 Tax=Phlebiopsis gigantea (strain 11061_1 CR5-6) TaxID=745531 RepID=A0A0C3NQK5_PHLG1|nr:hypothetical protein PHLGIDRAFT_421079 [Phlebiopsis gigantea 11061_1 CR5-6]
MTVIRDIAPSQWLSVSHGLSALAVSPVTWMQHATARLHSSKPERRQSRRNSRYKIQYCPFSCTSPWNHVNPGDPDGRMFPLLDDLRSAVASVTSLHLRANAMGSSCLAEPSRAYRG